MTANFPQTLTECIVQFSDADRANEFMTAMRWPDGVQCPRCQSKNLRQVKTRRLWVCKDCTGHNQFSVKVGTIFEDSAVSMGKWLTAIWLILNAKNGISSYEIHRGIGVTQKTAWFMLHRIRTAIETGTFKKFHGTVEADETFIGGAAANMHEDKRKKRIKGRGATGKAVVMGILERGDQCRPSQVHAKTLKVVDRRSLQGEIKQTVEAGSTVYTDCLPAYCPMDSDYRHETVDHAVEYVRGNVHTNGLENFWSLLKRTLSGTYVSVNAEHLMRYVNEQVFRYNARKEKDADRFADVLGRVAGKRITYKQLIGATA
jgi:transposase-like protein